MKVNKAEYLRYIVECLATLAFQVRFNNKLCFNDINHVCEDVYREILNSIYGWNLSLAKKNAAGIDLVFKSKSRGQGVVVQVSSECSKKKIDGSLSKLKKPKTKQVVKQYNGYHYYFMSLVREPPSCWTAKTFAPPRGLTFSCPDDVLSPNKLIEKCRVMKHINDLKRVYEVCRDHFQDGKISRNWATLKDSTGITMEEIKTSIARLTQMSSTLLPAVMLMRDYTEQYCAGDKSRRKQVLRLIEKLRFSFIDISNPIIDLKCWLFMCHELYRPVCDLDQLQSDIIACIEEIEDSNSVDKGIEQLRDLLTEFLETVGRLLGALAEATPHPEDVYDVFQTCVR